MHESRWIEIVFFSVHFIVDFEKRIGYGIINVKILFQNPSIINLTVVLNYLNLKTLLKKNKRIKVQTHESIPPQPKWAKFHERRRLPWQVLQWCQQICQGCQPCFCVPHRHHSHIKVLPWRHKGFSREGERVSRKKSTGKTRKAMQKMQFSLKLIKTIEEILHICTRKKRETLWG